MEYNLAPTVLGQPIEVLTPIGANTTLTLEPLDVPITINNAPILLTTVSTAYSTITNTLTGRYITLTAPYAGPALTTQTIIDPLDPNRITMFMVFVPDQDTSVIGMPSGVKQSSGVSLRFVSPLPSNSSQACLISSGPDISSPSIQSLSTGSSGTVQSLAGVPQFTTLTSTYSGSTNTTSTVAIPTLLGEIGTVVLQVPQSLADALQYTTITSVYSGSTIATATVAVPSLLSEIGIVVVQVPQTLAFPTMT
jgi:hypothetical protein